jgi:hypothetical protein
MQGVRREKQVTPPEAHAIHGEEGNGTPHDQCHDDQHHEGETPTATPGRSYTGQRIEVIRREVEVTTGVVFDGQGSVQFGATQPMDPQVALQMLAGRGCTERLEELEATTTPLTVNLPGTRGSIRAVADTVADAALSQVQPQ